MEYIQTYLIFLTSAIEFNFRFKIIHSPEYLIVIVLKNFLHLLARSAGLLLKIVCNGKETG